LHVLRYLRGNVSAGILFRADAAKWLCCYSDADFAAEVQHRKSITGYVWLHAGAAVRWMSRMQRITATSTTEAEYIAAATAFKEGLWLQKLVGELTGVQCALTAYCDNRAAVDVLHKGICERKTSISASNITISTSIWHLGHTWVALLWIGTDAMIADCLTKQLCAQKVAFQCRSLGLVV
jgi:hypothetical protein